jgi:hypothetical protein
MQAEVDMRQIYRHYSRTKIHARRWERADRETRIGDDRGFFLCRKWKKNKKTRSPGAG